MSKQVPLVRIARNCWIPAEQADDLQGRCAAVLDSCADDSALTSSTAAHLHGLWLPDDLDPRVHVATMAFARKGASMTRTKRPEFVAHRFEPGAGDIVTRDGLRMTSIPRTWRSLAAVLSLPDLVAAGDSALRAGATVEQLKEVIERAGRAPHIRKCRQALALLDPRSRSRPETHLRLIVVRAGVTAFRVNEPIHRDEGGWLAEPDLAIDAALLALEYQGADHANLRRMRKDITRGTDMRRSNWDVWPYGPSEVFGTPWAAEREIREHVRERAPEILRPVRNNSTRSVRRVAG